VREVFRNAVLLTLPVTLAAGLSCAVASRAGPADESVPERAPLVYVIPIHGPIEPALLFAIRRGLDEAVARKAAAVVFSMDTPGGTVDAAREIVHSIQSLDIPAYTFVEKDAFSGGAIVALATKRIYMAPGSVIGDAMPILMGLLGGVEDLPESIEEKMVSGVAALVRAAAEQGGHDPALAEAMVRRDVVYEIDGEVIKPEGRLLTLTDREASRMVGEGAARRPLLSSGTVDGIDDLLERAGLAGAVVRRFDVTWSERLARWLVLLGPLLFIAGLLGVYIEIKTPGFGVPGTLGILCLVLFFWGHHIAGLAGYEDVLLFGVGLLFLLVEVFVTPGFGLMGISGLLMMFVGVLLGMVRRYPGGGWFPPWEMWQRPMLTFSASLLAAGIAGAWIARRLPSAPLFSRVVLQAATTRRQGFAAAKDAAARVGQVGRTLAPLRPSGPARFGEERLDVITDGAFIDAGVDVRVAAVRGSRIVVEPAPRGESST
jgi:membrane-bound serine protease (ClpP class)